MVANVECINSFKNNFMIRKGDVFTGKWFTGRVEVEAIENNDLHVTLTKDGTTWTEVWNLEHTIAGFQRGDYF